MSVNPRPSSLLPACYASAACSPGGFRREALQPGPKRALCYTDRRGVLTVLPNYAFFKGRVVPYKHANVGVLTHALNYGSAVFGGLRAYWTEEEQQLFVFRPQDHFKRFLQSANIMCMELPYSADQLVDALTQLLRK